MFKTKYNLPLNFYHSCVKSCDLDLGLQQRAVISAEKATKAHNKTYTFIPKRVDKMYPNV